VLVDAPCRGGLLAGKMLSPIMAKLLLMSVIFATILLPSLAAGDPRPKRGLKRAFGAMLLFNFIYILAVMFVYPQICW
jgi:hypothetical protein